MKCSCGGNALVCGSILVVILAVGFIISWCLNE